MKHLLLAVLFGGMALNMMADDKVVIPDSTGFKFTDVKVVKSTPVKDQSKSGTCWCYSTNTFFETGFAKPETIIVRASSSLIPRLIR